MQTSQSCVTGGKLNVVAAVSSPPVSQITYLQAPQVRSTLTTPVNFTITSKVARNAGSPIPSPVPSLVSSSVTMVKGAAVGPYNLYSGSASIASTAGTKYGVSSGSFSDTFKDPADLGSVCASAPPTASSSTSTSVSSTKTSSSTSSATPTLSHKPTIGAYSFQGCYTEGDGVRALSGASLYNYTGSKYSEALIVALKSHLNLKTWSHEPSSVYASFVRRVLTFPSDTGTVCSRL